MDVVNRLEFEREAGMLERALPWDRGLSVFETTGIGFLLHHLPHPPPHLTDVNDMSEDCARDACL
jgi:hypothetical protein